MDKLVQEKLIQWKGSNIILKILSEELSRERLKKYLDILKIVLMKKYEHIFF